ncbi:MAG: hypothetical protein PHC44_12220 [Lutispora sp.]|nr:hypothetical protein [Lutispora sp.]
MKKKYGILVLLLCCILLVSCTSQAPENEKEAEVAKVQEKWYKLGDYEKAVALLDKHLKDASWEKTMVTKNDELQIIKLEKLNENYYLASYQISPIHPLTNMNYALVGFQENSCRTLNLDTADYISDVSYKNGVISFYCDGNNIVNGFRVFPHNINYDIAKGEFSRDQLYYSLERGSQVRLGNSINKVGFGDITEKEKEITFSFREIEGTVLAGGCFCPEIKAGVTFNKEDKQVFFIDFMNLFLSKDDEKAIMNLKDKEYISNVEIKTYEDFMSMNHTVIYLDFEDLSEYTFSFKYREQTGFEDLILTLR